MSVTTTGAGSRLSSGEWSPTTRAWLNGSAGGRPRGVTLGQTESAMLVVLLDSLGMLVGLLLLNAGIPDAGILVRALIPLLLGGLTWRNSRRYG
jgi:hypothetical protein